MDAGRFGRALGEGARAAAKAAMKAAEAAAATPPNRVPQTRPFAQGSSPKPSPQPKVRPTITQTVQQTTATAHNLKRGGKRFGETIWGPFAKLSGVLVLEVTGVLFGMFALVAALEAWKGRAALYTTGPQRQHEIFAILMLLFFGYFTASSFWKASHRSKQ